MPSASAKVEFNTGGGNSNSERVADAAAAAVSSGRIADAMAAAVGSPGLLAACTREYGGPSNPYWDGCMSGAFLPGTVKTGSTTKVVMPKFGTSSTKVVMPKLPSAGKYKVKIPSAVLKPRTQAEAIQGGREFEVSTGTIVIGLLLVGVAGYMIFKKK